MSTSFRLTFLVLLVTLLISCSTNKHIKPGEQSVLVDLSMVDGFQFKGKMSFSDGYEGGSGQVEWNKNRHQTQVKLKAPLSKKSWTLTDWLDHAEIQLSNGDVVYGQSATQLISDQVGWEIPWKALQHWVIGHNTVSGETVNQNLNGDYEILDQGWHIEYSRLQPYAQAGVLPHKIIARKDSYSIKLIVKHWQW